MNRLTSITCLVLALSIPLVGCGESKFPTDSEAKAAIDVFVQRDTENLIKLGAEAHIVDSKSFTVSVIGCTEISPQKVSCDLEFVGKVKVITTGSFIKGADGWMLFGGRILPVITNNQ